ncbi:MAG: peptidoglycan editing factor PgeF [Thermoclostridium sp.]|nr:peptidoglycan editing factor PgeF [Thermoclostridium sp.]
MWVSIPMGDNRIKAIFTTRSGGVSSFPFNTLNLSFQRADNMENVMENYRRLSKEFGVPMERMILSRQVHGSTVTVVDKSHCGMGLVRQSSYGDTDGLVTCERGVALVTFYADCTPVYLYDPVSCAIGLVHSGWRGTLQNIPAKAVQKMKEAFGCKPENMIAALGPHIHQCCFEVGADVYRQFSEVFPDMQDAMVPQKDKWYIDLSRIITRTLLREGLTASNINDVNRCTVCENELFFSHRGGKGNSGTGAALLMVS